MPPGKMSWRYEQNCFIDGIGQGALVIDYNMYNGSRNGQYFYGTHRTAFLPYNKQGQMALALLVEAFRRKLTFLVGVSLTTGQKNVVCWAGIHHKTSPSGGISCHGWPDNTYFERLTSELKDKGLDFS